ncbi:hypothetical protein LOK49_LG10G01272 [Camellia lanceoleosa]|uniref:Uncharacterized protein n=1 Tax=Camellia lanceoleosa TaxID=1840588 RepID=A0ACC0G844_9ERIC|nr:hypothetical protein LOK49_LG10G01272 [Camellia lanceoleosa]
MCFYVLHAGGKFGGSSSGYGVSGGLHGVGLSVVNALSEALEVTVWRDGMEYQQKYSRGKPLSTLMCHELPDESKDSRGTHIKLWHDKTIYLFPDDDARRLYVSNYGMLPSLLCSDAYSDTMLGYANSIRTIDGGTHIDGMKASLTIKKFQVISVKVADPEFEGQMKVLLISSLHLSPISIFVCLEYLILLLILSILERQGWEYLELHPDGEDFKEKALRYHKIIILTDADVDDAHIRTLLLLEQSSIFCSLQRALFDEGCIYVGVPPLYKVERGKKAYYCYDDAELKQLQSSFPSNASDNIQRFKMMPLQLWETTLDLEERLLKQLMVEDAAEANVVFSSLMGSRVDYRKELIQSSASMINLDQLDM